MQNITTTTELKKAIQVLEIEQAIQGQLFIDQFNLTYESLKPINLIKSTIKEISSSPILVDNLLGVASGYLTKKIIVGGSENIIRKLIGTVLQVGVSKLVSRHPESIKSVGQFIYQQIFSKKETNTDNDV
ncbi:MAG: hypothetical protein ABIJ97_17220 [Bacteroidota bacterium]